MIATSVISAGGIIASGFCDAATQQIARLRGTGERARMAQTVRSTLGIGATLSFVLACIVWVSAPFVAAHVVVSHVTSLRECVISLRIASLLIVVRSIESVGVSVHRAFDRYGSTVKISAAMRLLTLFTVAGLAICGQRTTSFLIATGVFLIGGTYLQLRELPHFVGEGSLWPSLEPTETWLLVSVGIFVWIQALGGVVFTQFDRILLGVSLGAAAVAPYALCIQFAQPLFGLTASTLHFLFPYLSRRANMISPKELRHTLLKAFICNFLLIVAGAGVLLLCGDRLLALWAGSALAKTAVQILPRIVLGSALMGLSVMGTYALQALGLFRIVALISLCSRAAMLALMLFLLHHMGLQGLVISRLCYGFTALFVYVPLLQIVIKTRRSSGSAIPIPPAKLTEGSAI
ncbi:polysaccharide biosynthesis protein [Granulicella sp. 5B5]|uniref:lipopolysaccharide biosynthesis protein n=1 Tax=Granulicella sp. 5B5 TaxID=1617967 RepID=UPI0015F76A57|nr:MATE family efflux transporter [Granulicella sp. 5B5]QMV20013.1 polysaccharide biosynthesis protein [Granulicella sp. 5B5]